MPSGFWAGGLEAYEKALKAHYHARLAELRRQLAECSEGERGRLNCDIDAVQSEYRAKIRHLNDLIF